MTTTAPSPRPVSALPATRPTRNDFADPAIQAFWLLRIGFTVAPILFGLDKFAHVLVNWDRYLAPEISDHLPGSAHQIMYVVGVIEIVAGLVVASARASAGTSSPRGSPASSSTCCSSAATGTSRCATSGCCSAR